ncbi:membrane protein insertase YidC [Treponema sp.]|uniref:membrane protein insertase YidC n=1 Tax=Treponema sp. TaxID=166 RepID=UPI003F0B53E6
MEKNTILAIALSTVVLVVSLFIQTKYIIPKQQEKAMKQAVELEVDRKAQEEKSKAENEMISAAAEENSENANEVEFYEISTEKVKVTFTNQGGDIVSYQLLDHKDKDTGAGVQMADKISPLNRAFSLSFGGTENPALNEIFNTSRKDDYTILFYRDYEVKNSDGSVSKFTLGKRYTFSPDDYVFKLDVSVIAKDGGEFGIGGAAYTLRTAPQIGPNYDKKNRYDVRQFLALNSGKRIRKNVSDKVYDLSSVDWAGAGGKYFTMLVKPVSPSDMTGRVKVSAGSEHESNCQIFMSRKPVSEESSNDTYYVYVGPRHERELIKYNDQTKNAWGISNAKFNEALQTTGFLSFIEIILKWCLEKINLVSHNWGISIIILTILLKIVLFPLNKNAAIGSLKMQKIQPKMKIIQEKYKNDQQKMSVEMQKLYKEAGYNPMSGCLPMIVQMFILFALYNVFNNYFEFRGASFIKGWIDDLSTGDSVWSWKTNIPFISAFTMNNLRLLPFIYTASQLLNGKITQYANAGSGASQSQMKFMMYGMPLMFFFLFYNVPSGLLLYWAVSNIIQIGQQLVINKVMKKKLSEIEKENAVDKNVLKFKGGKKRTR